MTCNHEWGGVVIPGPVNRIVIDQCESCGELRLPDAAPHAQEPARQPVALIAQKVGDYRVTVAEDAITVSRGRDIVFAYSAGDAEPINARQPVGQIVGYMDPNAEFLLPRPDGCVLMGKIEVCLWRTPSGKYTKPLYDAPAQAVDLDAVREALQAAEGLATICASVDGYSREEVAASGRAMRQQFADALAKVDSQAVGK